jgi:hypothetical protein
MPEASANLPIRRLTLYKHGVGFVERRGAVEGAEVALVFRADEVNDALKSLLALDLQGGQVLGVHYETPADRDARLAESGIHLRPGASLRDLLRGLRGWQVRLTIGAGSNAEGYTGRLLGVDTIRGRPLTKARVTLLEADSARIVSLPLADLTNVELLEDRAVHDLRFFLDTSRTEESHRTVTVRLSPGSHDLAVSYLVPSPTWRVSYRLVAASKGDGDGAGPAGGELLLQGWGLFDNRMEEDLQDVAVTLVAGQPISFIYDLAASRIPQRPVIEDEARVAAGPVEFSGMALSAPLDEEERTYAAAPAMRKAYSMRAAEPRAMDMDRLAAAAPPTATGSDLGELFQYEVTAPVTVKRGESALVPILNARVPYRRQLLYNGAKMPEHPVAALRFTNTTGLVLERGPVTVLEDGDYRGEALVSFTKTGSEVYLAFAVELGVKVREETKQRSEVAGLRLERAYIHIQHASITTTTYICESSLAEDRVITIERPTRTDADLVDTRAPDERNAEFARWQVTCPARGTARFSVSERTRWWRQEQVLDQSYAQLQAYMRDRWLDRDSLARIKSLLDERQGIANNEKETGRLQAERNDIYARQEQVRKNMGALGAGGEEGALRQKLFKQLGAGEDRLAAIDARIAALRADSDTRQGRIDAGLAALGS